LALGGNSLMINMVFNWLIYGFKTFVLKKELPYLLGLVITDKCNLNCFYCESKNSGKHHFSFEQAKETLRDAYNRGHRALYFTGGEPMVWEDGGHSLDELVSFARALGFLEVLIYTNGTQPLSIKQSSYIVTIDGPREIHNQIRSHSYDLVLRNVDMAVTKAVFASITFTKANVHYLHQFVKEVTATNLFKGIFFNFLTHWPEIMEEYGLSLDEKKQLLDNIWNLKKKGYPIAFSWATYKALKNNDWKRPIPQIELGTKDKVFKCCRDVGNPSICENCGYVNCAWISQILALKPSAIWQAIRIVGT
jgi:Fe-coproporphyrin III synthase